MNPRQGLLSNPFKITVPALKAPHLSMYKEPPVRAFQSLVIKSHHGQLMNCYSFLPNGQPFSENYVNNRWMLILCFL